MESVPLLDRAGRRRSPRNKGLRYPPDPPWVLLLARVRRAVCATATETKASVRPLTPG